MNLDEFTPDNNGAGQLNQGQIIGGFFLKTNEQFAKVSGHCVLSPFFPWSVGFFPTDSSAEVLLPCSIQALPRPADPFHFIILFQTFGFSKNPAANHFGNVLCTVLPLPYSCGNASH
jgi:hypothetical protein